MRTYQQIQTQCTSITDSMMAILQVYKEAIASITKDHLLPGHMSLVTQMITN